METGSAGVQTMSVQTEINSVQMNTFKISAACHVEQVGF